MYANSMGVLKLKMYFVCRQVLLANMANMEVMFALTLLLVMSFLAYAQVIIGDDYCTDGNQGSSVHCAGSTSFFVRCYGGGGHLYSSNFEYSSRLVKKNCPTGTYCAPQFANNTISCRQPALLKPMIKVGNTFKCFNVTTFPDDLTIAYVVYFSVFDANNGQLAYANVHMGVFACDGDYFDPRFNVSYHGVNQFGMETLNPHGCDQTTMLQVCMNKVSRPNATVAVFAEADDIYYIEEPQ